LRPEVRTRVVDDDQFVSDVGIVGRGMQRFDRAAQQLFFVVGRDNERNHV